MKKTTFPLILVVVLGTFPRTFADESTRFAAMTPDDVRAFEIEVMEKVADLALIPPKLNTSPLPEYGYDRLDYGMTIGIDRTPSGGGR